MAKRKWLTWPGRVCSELNGVSGVAGIGGTVLGTAGMTFFASTIAAPIFGIAGAALTSGALALAIWRGFPPKIQSPSALVGRSVVLNELINVSPPLKKLAIVGPSRAGKTTLRNRIAHIPAAGERTQVVSAQIVALSGAPEVHAAILDGGGEKFSQQFRISEPSDYLCIVLDHNTSDREGDVLGPRLHEHRQFLEQIRLHLVETRAPAKLCVGILLNKQDLWKGADQAQQDAMIRFGDEELQRWQTSNLAANVTVHAHSNESGNDIAHFIARVRTVFQA